ncbi:MAG: IPT/TIG domain-containing protein, partial [Actinomycetota bacterium]|nr:IPT/TIG domain-containing protein [Actinomycetota bacterium]
MSKLRRAAWRLIGLTVLAVPLAAAATAYACGPVASLTLSPSAGAPGSTVTVKGSGFYTFGSGGQVEIWLGSTTTTTVSSTPPVLATVSPAGPSSSFSVDVTIPADVAPGDYYVAATQLQSDGTSSGVVARQPFTVVAPPTPVVQPPVPVITSPG